MLNFEAPKVATPTELVRTEVPTADGHPLVMKPTRNDVLLDAWMSANKATIDQHLHQYGGILFKGFKLPDSAAFHKAVAALKENLMDYSDRSSPRTKLNTDKVYTSTEHPSDQTINMHNELAYSHNWPMRIAFYCRVAAAEGGETPVADSRKVYQALSPTTQQAFAEKGILYVRRLHEGIGLSWQEVFQTEDAAVVEQHCRDRKMDFEWKSANDLTISWQRPAVDTRAHRRAVKFVRP